MTQETKVNVKNSQKPDLLGAGKIKLNSHAPPKWAPPPVAPTACFISGSLVLMADMSWKTIELVEVGELMWSVDGPVKCIEQYVTHLGDRRMITFHDESLFWSEDHAFWTKDMLGDEWWWSYDADKWRLAVDTGSMGGISDNFSIRSGEIALEYAHLDGWKLQKSKVIEKSFNQTTSLFLCKTDSAPIIVNGYLVGAGVNKSNFDQFKWKKVSVEQLNKDSLLA